MAKKKRKKSKSKRKKRTTPKWSAANRRAYKSAKRALIRSFNKKAAG